MAWIPSNLNVERRSIAPGEIKRGGKLIEVRERRIVSLVLYVLICISLLDVQVSRKVRCGGMLLTYGTSRWNRLRGCGVVYKFMHFTGSSDVVNEDYRRQGTEWGPIGIPLLSVFQEEKKLTDPTTLATV